MQFSRDLDVQHKTAFVLAHKLREAIASETKGAKLFGDVEIDGAYFGGHVRPANVKVNHRDRRLSENQSGKRRVMIGIRQREGRTLAFVSKHEAEDVEIAKQVVDRLAVIHVRQRITRPKRLVVMAPKIIAAINLEPGHSVASTRRTDSLTRRRSPTSGSIGHTPQAPKPS